MDLGADHGCTTGSGATSTRTSACPALRVCAADDLSRTCPIRFASLPSASQSPDSGIATAADASQVYYPLCPARILTRVMLNPSRGGGMLGAGCSGVAVVVRSVQFDQNGCWFSLAQCGMGENVTA